MKDRISALADLLSPRVVVHVGASESGIYPADIFKSLAASPVTLYAVNPRRSEVFGHACLASLADLPVRPEDEGGGKADLAVITVPAAAVPGVLADCVDAGIRQAVVISAGFAEAGAGGRALQEEIEAFGDRIHILGPNCAGFANVAGNVIAARLYSRAAPGGISFVSQSGALMMALHGAFAERGAGLRALVSVGNQAGFRLSDFLSYFASDAATTVAAAFIEGMPDGGEFVDAVKKCLAAGKPVIAIKSGRTELGRKLAATHTAALAGEGRVFEAICRQYGIILVDDIEDMVATSLVACAAADSPLDRIAWITQSGGLGSLAGDLAKSAGIEPEPFPPELGPGQGSVQGPILNPADFGGDRMRGSAVRDTLAPFLGHERIDAAVLLFAKNPNRDVELETARSLIAARSEFGKPVFVVWVGPTLPADGGGSGAKSALQTLRDAGIPVFDSPGPCVRALGRLCAWRRFTEEWRAAGLASQSTPEPSESRGRGGDCADGVPKPTGPAEKGMLGHEAAQSLFRTFGIPFVESVFIPAGGPGTGQDDSHAGPYPEALLRSSCEVTIGYGPAYNPFLTERTIPRSSAPGFVHSRAGFIPPGCCEVVDPGAALAALAAEAASPLFSRGAVSARLAADCDRAGKSGTRCASVVLKLLAPGFSHKSDSGLVALDLDSPEEVGASALGMLSRIPEDCRPEGFLVQPMVRGGREVFIGAQVDAQFGPVVAFGPGGIFVELLGGVDFLRPPFDRKEAALFVKRNAVWPILAGARGAKPADMGALLDALVGLGNLMLAKGGRIQSVDLNPFVVFDEGSGGFALDARVGEAQV